MEQCNGHRIKGNSVAHGGCSLQHGIVGEGARDETACWGSCASHNIGPGESAPLKERQKTKPEACPKTASSVAFTPHTRGAHPTPVWRSPHTSVTSTPHSPVTAPAQQQGSGHAERLQIAAARGTPSSASHAKLPSCTCFVRITERVFSIDAPGCITSTLT